MLFALVSCNDRSDRFCSQLDEDAFKNKQVKRFMLESKKEVPCNIALRLVSLVIDTYPVFHPDTPSDMSGRNRTNLP